MKKTVYIIAGLSLIFQSACELEIEPTDKLSTEVLLSIDDGIDVATNGNYDLLKVTQGFRGAGPNLNNAYVRHLYQMGEFSGDNVMYTQFSSDPLYLVFTRNHVNTQENSAYIWYIAYKLMLGANSIIENSVEGESGETDHIIGENYFLRALVTFDLLRFFAQPYSHGRDNLGVVLKKSASSPAVQSRSTVGECYDSVVGDLLKAVDLMGQSKHRGVEYASKEAAWALLSRAYLYMEDNDKAIEFADNVISSSRFSLAGNGVYLDNFANTQNSTESIFIIKHINPDDHKGKQGSIGSMYYDDGNGTGWGEVFVSQTFLDLIQQHPTDVRNDLIVINGNLKNGYPIRYITKFSGQEGVVNLASPQYLRLSEVYLNRAEAYAKNGNDTDALTDVNVIRARAGLTGTALYTLANLGGRSVLDIVLEERRLELAYEGHRAIDQFRNKRDLDRSYEGIHLAEGETTQTIPWNDPRNIFYIPQGEISYNPACEQNP
ncbi:Starch-binding associating with outer membrane [Reichenbachiella faecimaris]|uniref:Starch-binding associating with outer membrane n=1 Tax=Reichenbachiella faecimaris TaxID=692418 RepID=A0A1W2G822_REIFA|nr:RagB/SusD family nutrient uptake outer membrane protein [Reichenbachiella faecimaris]SMD32830.1 Starch-binding associating with outer membrane [Reichenbachiella faecimaris]